MAKLHRLMHSRARLPEHPLRARAPAAVRTTSGGSAMAVCSTPSSVRPPRQAIASTISRDGAGMARTRAASSSATSERPRCARRAGSSHRHPAAVTLSAPCLRSAFSNSTISYGLPDVCGASTSTRSAAVGRVDVEHVRHHGDHARGRQVVQPQMTHAGLIPPSRHHRRQQRMAASPRRRDTRPPATSPRSAPR